MDIGEIIKLAIEALSGQLGVVAQVVGVVVGVVGTLRLVMKPVMTAVQAIVDATPTTSDNELLEKVKAHPVAKMALFLLDYIASIKVPKKQ